MKKSVKIMTVSVCTLMMAALAGYGMQYGVTPEQKLMESTTASGEKASETAVQLKTSAEMAQNAVEIALSDPAGWTSVQGAEVQGNTLTIKEAGTYRIHGSLKEGQLAVDCKGEVILILDGAEITNAEEAAIQILDAKHTLLYLQENTVNTIVSGTEKEITVKEESEDDSASGAAIYAKDNLSIAGTGTLNVSGYINNGIATTDHLTVVSGNLQITAVNNGLKGKDSVTVLDGTLSIHSGNDGIKANNDTDEGCGYIEIRGGDFEIVSLGDGVQAETNLLVEGGEIRITAGEVSSLNTPDEQTAGTPMEGMFNEGPFGFREDRTPPEGMGEMPEDMQSMFPKGEKMEDGFRGQEGQMPSMPQFDGETQMPRGEKGMDREYGGWMPSGQVGSMPAGNGMPNGFPGEMTTEETTSSQSSAKGMKSGSLLKVTGGSVTITSSDDCVHSNGDVVLSGGTFLLSSGDDAVHADNALTIEDGEITVTQSYEGLEGYIIAVNGGTISVTASDDGINAGGESTGTASAPCLTISGGKIYVNAAGDGLDSNGDLVIEGGETVIDGPGSSGNGALDSGSENGGSLLSEGGTILAIGASGMAESFHSDSSQCSFHQTLPQTMPAGTVITITASDGTVLFEHTSAKSFGSVVFSSPQLVLGETYTVSAGEWSTSFTLDTVAWGSNSGFGMPMGFGGNHH